MSFYCHSSLTSITSGALPNSFAAFRYSFACLISDAVYSGIIVFMIFQKYFRSGKRPFGKFSGKYCMNYLSFYIYGQKLRTDSSLYLGTLIRLTLLSSSNFFFSLRTSLRKSLFILYIQDQVMTWKLTCIRVASKVGVALWSIWWNHFWMRTCQIIHVAWVLAS